MSDSIIDIFNHCLPPRYVKACKDCLTKPLVMFDRAVEKKGMCDLGERLKIMDAFPGYRQILSLVSPSPEMITGTKKSPELARIGNDSLAEWCSSRPDHFPGFIATLPMNNPAAAKEEARRSLDELGALGVQLYTHVNGKPIDRPEYMAILEYLAERNCPVWLHPLRPSSQPDYLDENISKYDLWWAFGWPHETSVCAGRLVFSGIFDRWPDFKIITHHAGGTIPMMEGRLDGGLKSLGNRYGPEDSHATKTELKEKPIDAFRRFYADTATFGSRLAIDAGLAFFGSEKVLFATDFPFAGIGESLQTVGHLDRSNLFRNAQRLLSSKLS